MLDSSLAMHKRHALAVCVIPRRAYEYWRPYPFSRLCARARLSRVHHLRQRGPVKSPALGTLSSMLPLLRPLGDQKYRTTSLYYAFNEKEEWSHDRSMRIPDFLVAPLPD